MRIFGGEILKGEKVSDEGDARRCVMGLILGSCEMARVLG